MKIAQINATCGVGSTGKICAGISKAMDASGIENYILYSGRTDGNSKGIPFSSGAYTKLQAMKSRVLGNYGFNARHASRRMCAKLEKIKPDLVHLHNIHSHDCDLKQLFRHFKAKNTKLIWTFHDCWAFTGYCPHFAMMKCEKWKTKCTGCIQRREYSWFFDRCTELYRKKKELFSGLDLTIVTPSQWLADLVKQSFLKDYPVKVINNGIDLSIFQPVESNFRAQYSCERKKLILGVAFDWGPRKGLDVFVKLAKRLDSEKYQIVLVGTNGQIDKQLPKNIISIHRTQNQAELAQIYTAADVLVNPTREENFPTVNIESLACGTPVITFRTGGSPEIPDETCGCVVECDDVDALCKAVTQVCENMPFSAEACIKRAARFEAGEKFREYVDLYEEVLHE